MADPLKLTRRQFVQGMAVSSVAGPSLIKAAADLNVVVVGAGAFGGWSADAWSPGHSRASSGGVTRVIRAIYGADRVYSEMVARAFRWWRDLESTLGHHLYVETGALWMLRDENDAYIRSALPICEELGFRIDQLTPGQAARRWPQIDFSGIRKLYYERQAGALSARRSCQSLRHHLVASGGQYRTGRVEATESKNGRMSAVRLSDGSVLSADSFVFCCGPWLGQLFPDFIGSAVRPTRQDVLYFGTPAGSDEFRVGQFPVWIDFGERVFYGLPDIHGHGFKLADDTRGAQIDPSNMERSPDPAAIARGRELLATRFPRMKDAPLIESRVCQYENSPDGHLILDRHPGLDNAWVAGGGSGHGFKLSPVVGEQVAEAVMGLAEPPPAFALSRLAESTERATQFEAGNRD
jgi:glycine/D-amino acid oxidase-like deaminating enzyme